MKTVISAATLTVALLGTNVALADHPQGRASGAYAHAPPIVSPDRSGKARRGASPHDVFSYDGEYLGRDPDPNIRLQLLRDYPWNRNGG